MIKKIIKRNNIFQFSRYQLVAFTNYSSRVFLIYLFSDKYLFNYLVVFWATLAYVIMQGYFLHKKFVFKSNSNSVKRYIITNLFFGLFDYFISSAFKVYLNFFSIAFVASSIFTTLFRYFIYKKYVFTNH